MAATRVLNFAGEYLDTTFITDVDTAHFQFGLEPVDEKVYDLTIASIDSKGKRKEYTMTASARDFEVLSNLIKTVLTTNAARKSK
jgi:hypothetical protein